MIVKKFWTTTKTGKWDKFSYKGKYYPIREIHWMGLFLFGFIPFYIESIEVFYYGRK